MFLSLAGLLPIHNPASQPSLLNSGLLTPFPDKHNACNKKTTCNKWVKSSPTCFKEWPKELINTKTFPPELILSNPSKVASHQTSTLLSKAMFSPTLPKHHEPICLLFSVAPPSLAERFPTQEMSPRSLLGVPKLLKTQPIPQRMQWSIA